MGPENDATIDGMTIWIGDTKLGTLKEIEAATVTLPDVEPDDTPPLGGTMWTSGTASFQFAANAWPTCRTRKRFIKLVGGVFGMQRRDAEALARAAMAQGCPSYSDLWADVFSYFTGRILQYLFGDVTTTD